MGLKGKISIMSLCLAVIAAIAVLMLYNPRDDESGIVMIILGVFMLILIAIVDAIGMVGGVMEDAVYELEKLNKNVEKLNQTLTIQNSGGTIAKPEIKPQNAGNSNNRNGNAPYYCGKCSYSGPYEGNCPNCGSSMKIFNN